MSLPLAVHRRLDALAEAAEDVGATRGEIAGALIAVAEIDAGYLERLILDYRKMSVGAVVPPAAADEETPGGDVLILERRPPGRPGRRRKPR